MATKTIKTRAERRALIGRVAFFVAAVVLNGAAIGASAVLFFFG